MKSKIFYQRNLTHINPIEVTYFVTFCLLCFGQSNQRGLCENRADWEWNYVKESMKSLYESIKTRLGRVEVRKLLVRLGKTALPKPNHQLRFRQSNQIDLENKKSLIGIYLIAFRYYDSRGLS